MQLRIIVDNRLRFPADTPAGLIKLFKAATSHPNPEYAKKRGMGLWTGNTPSSIKTWCEDESGFSMPRGTTQLVRDTCKPLDVYPRFIDQRANETVFWKPFQLEPRPYQVTGIDACVRYEQGVVKAPTGSGKTMMALACLPRLKQRALVIMRDGNLLDQWKERAVSCLGIGARDIGICKGGKKTIGENLTLALQQTLYSKSFPLEDFAKQFGAVIVDEVHDSAARTVNETIDAFPARIRLGFSADHTRKDRKEFLIEDQFGSVIYEVERQHLESQGSVVPVVVRLVPTNFVADWYVRGDTDFNRLITEMTTDLKRCELVRSVVLELVQEGIVPALVFTHRREHAARLAERDLLADGVTAGLLLGSADNAAEFEESKALLLSGVLKVAVGTFKAVGQGIDIPNVMAGVCATPIGHNKQFFGQVRGRICRVVPGKRVGHLYYLWDQMVFPEAARNMQKWNDGLVEIYDSGRGGWVTYR